MRRRTLLRYAVAIAGALRFPTIRIWAETASFPGTREQTLRELAAAVLPASLGRGGTDRIAEEFAVWVRGYRPAADMEHGYGITRLRQTPPSPATKYMEQLSRLQQLGLSREHIEEELRAAQLDALPLSPSGKHVIADLMSFFFRGSEANDLCYRAAIGRDACRGLRGSEQAPNPLTSKK